jgi:O-antigen ligase
VLWAAGQLFSFETAFLLFIFSAVYKPDPRFASFPGDMTLFFFGLSVAAGLVPLLRGSLLYLPGIKGVSAGAVLVLWIAASQLWSPSEIYANEKLALVGAGNLWCLVATAMIISSSRARVWRFLILLLIFGVAVGVDYTISSAVEPDRQRVRGVLTIGENYLGLGRLSGLAALVAFALWLQSPPRSMRGPLLLAALAVCGYALLKGGGRMPAAAMAAGTLLPTVLSFRLPRAQLVISRRVLASLGLIVVLAIGVTSLAMSGASSLRTLQRFDKFLSEESDDASAGARFKLWQGAVRLWLEQPIVGHGVGAWPVLYFGRDYRHYPHNMVLELLVEFGLIGLVLFAMLVVVLAQRMSVRRLRDDPALMCAVMLCINAFSNAMTTGDLADNRNLFAVIGLLAMRPPPEGQIHVGTQGRSPDVGAPALRHAHTS